MFDREEYEYLLADLQEYGKTRWEQAKLTVLDKVSRIVGLLLFGLTVILIVFVVVALGGVALISALSNCMPTWAAVLIVAGLWILLLVIVVCLRKRLFLNPMLAAISAILFARQPKRKLTIENVQQQSEMLAYKATEQEKNLQRETERIQRSWVGLFERFATVRSLLDRVIGRIFSRK
ncbi:MAG: phage holin family protein [Paludibacteraceae bacterium]|nr:phage holin family protein [Paludibacteraceae bacterium]